MSHRLPLSLAIRATPRVRPLLEGLVQPEGIDLIASVLPPPDVFWRQLKFGDFDVSEMSLSSLMIAVANGDERWKALPVFPDRRFFHANMFVRADAGIEKPEDLRGRRIGVPDYQMTAALWGRGALMHEFGVHPTDVTWYMERTEQFSHAEAVGFRAPEGVTIEHIPAHRTQEDMMLSGELDASLHYVRYATMIDRSKSDPQPDKINYLFPDRDAERARYFGRLGFVPMNHCIAIRSELLERHPWIAINLYSAFLESKAVNRDRALESIELNREAGLIDQESAEGLAVDLFPYGVPDNKIALETITSYSHEQGLTPRKLEPEEFFAESVLTL